MTTKKLTLIAGVLILIAGIWLGISYFNKKDTTQVNPYEGKWEMNFIGKTEGNYLTTADYREKADKKNFGALDAPFVSQQGTFTLSDKNHFTSKITVTLNLDGTEGQQLYEADGTYKVTSKADDLVLTYASTKIKTITDEKIEFNKAQLAEKNQAVKTNKTEVLYFHDDNTLYSIIYNPVDNISTLSIYKKSN